MPFFTFHFIPYTPLCGDRNRDLPLKRQIGPTPPPQKKKKRKEKERDRKGKERKEKRIKEKEIKELAREEWRREEKVSRTTYSPPFDNTMKQFVDHVIEL